MIPALLIFHIYTVDYFLIETKTPIMYQKIITRILLLALSLTFIQNLQAQKDTRLEERTLQSAISNYNADKSFSQTAAFLIYGKTSVENDEIHGTNRIQFFMQDGSKMRNFNYQYEKSRGQIDMPKILKNSRITFLGHQLIVEDLNQNKVYSFLIDGYEAVVPNIATESGIGIGQGIRTL